MKTTESIKINGGLLIAQTLGCKRVLLKVKIGYFRVFDLARMFYVNLLKN